MTNPDTSLTTDPDPSLLVVESFIDGEADRSRGAEERPVPPRRAVTHLVELLALREAVWTMAPRGYATAERTRGPFERGVRGLPSQPP